MTLNDISNILAALLIFLFIYAILEDRKVRKKRKYDNSFQDANDEANKKYPDDRALRKSFIDGAAFREDSYKKH